MTVDHGGRTEAFLRAWRRLPRAELLTVAVAVAGLCIRFIIYLHDRPFWGDEAAVGLSFQHRGLIDLLTQPLDVKQSAPPGFIAVVAAIVSFVRVDDWSLRIAPFVAGVATVGLSVPLASRAYRFRAAGVLFVALVALSPALIYYSTELKPYSFDAMISVALLLAYRSRNNYALPIVAFASPLVSQTSIFVFSALLAWMVIEFLFTREGLKRIIVSMICFALGFAIYLLYFRAAGASPAGLVVWWSGKDAFAPLSLQQAGWYWRAAQDLTRLIYQLLGAAWPGVFPQTPVLAAQTIFVLACLVLSVLSRKPEAYIAVLCIVFTLVTSMLKIYPFSSRLILFLVPLAAISIAAALEFALSRNVLAGSLFGLLAALALSPTLSVISRTIRHPPQADISDAIDIVSQKAAPNGIVCALFGTYATVKFYEHIYRPDLRVFMVGLNQNNKLMLNDDIKQCWFVVERGEDRSKQMIENGMVHTVWERYWPKISLLLISKN